MDNSAVQLIGSPCGQHGPYTFYKAFKYVKNGYKRIVRLSEFFFVKLWSDSDLVCIGELQLLWVDKNSEQVLSSLRLYFLPENTPEGRMDHGEDEVLAISEKVVLRLDDLITWITVDAEWTWGRLAKWEAEVKEPKIENTEAVPIAEVSVDFCDVDKEQLFLDEKLMKGAAVIILSYPTYCRYRAMMKRLEGVEDEYLKLTIVKILGGFSSSGKNTRVLFCRDTFDYPELEGHELLCNHLAPKLKGRPRGRRKKRSVSPGSESNESESSVCNVFNITKTKIMTEGNPNGLRSDGCRRRSTRSLVGNVESKEFLRKLYAYMKSNHTPIGRIPSLGYKELDFYSFFTKVNKLGGYAAVSTNRLWKSIYDDLSGNHISTSATTIIRRHYERYLLPYEKHLKGLEYKSADKKRIKSGSMSDGDSSESTSDSGSSTPVPQLIIVPILPTLTSESKSEPSTPEKTESKPEIKTSALRSIRVKPDRLRESISKEKPIGIDKLSNCENQKVIEIKIESPKGDNGMTNGLTVEIIGPVPAIAPQDPSREIKRDSPPAIAEKTPNSSLCSPPSSINTQKEKVLSPADGKENIATCNTINNISGAHKIVEIDLTEVPYKPKSPEIVQCEPDTPSIISNATLNNSLLHTVKKRKLDILKEGGLEVTPVRAANSEVKDNKETRPSVIHHPTGLPGATVSQLSITISSDKQTANNLESLKSHQNDIQSVPSSIMRSKMIKSPLPAKSSFLYLNGQSPPKVVQSKSIYSYSEKTVYGNPKDYFTPPLRPPHAPKVIEIPRHFGGEILDLTVKSPQKPVVEIMRVPNILRGPFCKEILSKPSFRKSSLPVLDARVGSNLEITLVGPNSQRPMHNFNNLQASVPHSFVNSKAAQKRTFSGSFVPKKEENGRLPYPVPTQPYVPRDKHQNIDSPNFNRNVISKTEARPLKPPPTPPQKNYPNTPSVLPGYLSQLSMASKLMPPYVPSIDPVYYSALQSLYPHNPLSSVPPFFPVPTPEQLQFYTDLMARNAQMRFPFPYQQDGSSSVTANSQTHFKQQ